MSSTGLPEEVVLPGSEPSVSVETYLRTVSIPFAYVEDILSRHMYSVSQRKKKEQTIKGFEDENNCFHYIFYVNTNYIIFTLLALPLDRLILVLLSF